jgi:hypothetical protein
LIWSLTLREEHGLWVFDNRMLRKNIIGKVLILRFFIMKIYSVLCYSAVTPWRMNFPKLLGNLSFIYPTIRQFNRHTY